MNKDLYVDELIQTVLNCKKGLISSFSDIYQEKSWSKCFSEEDMKKLTDVLGLSLKNPPDTLCQCIKFYCSDIRELRLFKNGSCEHCGSGYGTMAVYDSFSIPLFENKCRLEFSKFTDETLRSWLKTALKDYQPKETTLDYIYKDTSTRIAYLVTVTCNGELITHKEDLYHYSLPKITYRRDSSYDYTLERKVNSFHNKNWLNIHIETENLDEFLSLNNLVKE